MQEELLHYIWKTRSYRPIKLQTTDGQELTISNPGQHNENAGPDFLEAQVTIGAVIWSGAIEIHIKASDWIQHNHSVDPAYESVILHVVWEDDRRILHPDGSPIPCLKLSNYVDEKLLNNYQLLSEQLHEIPCHFQLNKVPDIYQHNMLEKAAIRRLASKASEVTTMLSKNQNDWEDTCYQLLLGAFGMKVNKRPMMRLAEQLPYKWIRKHQSDQLTLEALLYGQSGLILAREDPYGKSLEKSYQYLSHKYQLKSSLARSQWKFSRMRPANFPSIRLAQLASFFHRCTNLFEQIIQASNTIEIYTLFNDAVSPYWQSHFDFEKLAKQPAKHLIGQQMLHHLIINLFTPILAAASNHFDQPDYMDKAIQWLENTPAESNKITRKYSSLALNTHNALESQGCLSLYYDYCLGKRCLSCDIGAAILNK